MRLIVAGIGLTLAGAAAAQGAGSEAATRTFVLDRAATAAIGERIMVAPGRVFGGGYGWERGAGRFFSVSVPPGNYRVTVQLGRRERASVTTVRAEARRLMLDAVAVPAGTTVSHSFVVNVRDAALVPPPPDAPGGDAVRLTPAERRSADWDGKLTLEFGGDRAAVDAVTIAPVVVPTIFLLGDSTVADQPAEPTASWGQMLPVFFRPDIAVANHAQSGETLKSFMTELRLAKVLQTARPGDWALIQFGHNDQKASWPQTYAPAATTFRDYLRAWIDELRQRGVSPVLVTPPDRRFWSGDRIRTTLADYVAAIKAVGVERDVPVIDLNAASIAFYQALGPARAPLAFNDGGRDATHHDDYGAWVLARAVAAGMAAARLPLAVHVAPALAPFDPARPPDPASFHLEPSIRRGSTRPAGS